MKSKSILKMVGILLLCLVIGVSIILALYYFLPSRQRNEGLNLYEAKAFSSEKEIVQVLKEYQNYYKTNEIMNYFMLKGAVLEDAADAPTDSGTDSDSQGSLDFSSTNTQVEGIDESDIVKTDGKYLYVLNTKGLQIISVTQGDMQIVSCIDVQAREFYIYENYVITLGKYSGIAVYDTQTKASPTLALSVEHNGYTLTTRLKDGIIYYVDKVYATLEKDGAVYPSTSINGGDFVQEDIGNVYYFEGIPNKEYLVIGKIDLKTLEHQCKSYLGAGNGLYMSHDYLYVYSNDYSKQYFTNGIRSYRDSSVYTQTRILKFDLSNLNFVNGTSVDGGVKDQFCLDEYDGYLRIATTVNSSEYSLVTVLDENMQRIGQTDKIAENESIYSCRFNGESASIVTFKQIDPLFKVDLSNPREPKVSKGLKKEGVSYYLHFIEGTDYLIGLGYDTTSSGATRGIEVALFDNSGEDAEIINIVVIGASYASSEALYNHKAILYDKERDMFGFSASVWDEQSSTSKEGYYLFGFMGGTLELREKIEHDASLDSRYNYIYTGSAQNESYDITRAVQIGDYLYSISARIIQSHDIINGFNTVQTIEI